ncbi:hypothetical protein AB1I80_06585 [Bacillus paranthracis]|uniref:hypothetical protein n=1 Tax=Bacillus paranthracis TaxID=2026186 RepID=UPI003555E520
MLTKGNAKKIGVIKEKLHAGKEMGIEVAEMATIVKRDEGATVSEQALAEALKRILILQCEVHYLQCTLEDNKIGFDAISPIELVD